MTMMEEQVGEATDNDALTFEEQDELFGNADVILEPDDGGYPPDGWEAGIQAPPVPTKKKHAGKGPTSSANIAVRERQRRALELRKAGATYQAIADTLGYGSVNGAYHAVKRSMELSITEPAKELRTIQYERLNHLAMVVWPLAMAGDLKAVAQYQSIMRDMNEMMGTNTPTRIEADINVTHAGAIIVADVDGDEYLKAMQAMVLDGEEQQKRNEAYERGELNASSEFIETPIGGFMEEENENENGDDENDIIDAVLVEHDEMASPSKVKNQGETKKTPRKVIDSATGKTSETGTK